jgi:hypothetical protein
MKASEIATEAARLVSGDRNDTHGDAAKNMGNISALWNAYIGNRPNWEAELTGEDVAIMMALLKIARTQTGSLNLDDHIDAAGYVAIAGEIAQGAFRKVED